MTTVFAALAAAISTFSARIAHAVGLRVPLGTSPLEETRDVSSIGEYIRAIYSFGIVVGAFLAVLMIVFQAIRYMVSAGNVATQQAARTRIQEALIGFILLVGAYLVLFTINPALVNLSLTP